MVFLAVFFAVNFLTSEKSPTVWQDEVMYADPAVNLYQGRGFTSGAWYEQSPDAFWAGNVPLYEFVLFGWLKAAGFSLVSVRSFHYVAITGALVLLWLALWRLNLVRSGRGRLAFCVLLGCCSSVTFVFRSARPESLSLLLVGMVLCTCTLPSRPLRLAGLFLLGMLLLWSGLQMAAYLFVMAAVIWIWTIGKWRQESLSLGLGTGAGVLLLYWFYSSHHVWREFLASIAHHTIAAAATSAGADNPIKGYGNLSRKLHQLPSLYFDYSFVPVFLLAAGLSWKKLRAGGFTWRSSLVFGIAASTVVPAALFVVGVYPIYYYWMGFLPLAIVVCRELDQFAPYPPSLPVRAAIIGALILTCLLGLPRRLLTAAGEWGGRSYAPLMRLAEPYAGRDQTVFCNFQAYYAAKQHGALVILPSGLRGLKPDDRKKVSVAIVASGQAGTAQYLAGEFGGVWRDTDAKLAVGDGRSFLGLREQLGARQYNLAVYQKAGTQSP